MGLPLDRPGYYRPVPGAPKGLDAVRHISEVKSYLNFGGSHEIHQ